MRVQFDVTEAAKGQQQATLGGPLQNALMSIHPDLFPEVTIGSDLA
jgi:hypothetical protein